MEKADDRYGYPGNFSLFKCSRCDFIETFPRLSDLESSDLYTNYYPRKNVSAEDVLQSVNKDHAFIRWLKGLHNTAHYHISKGTRVLDIGCGSGTSLLEIKNMDAEPYGTEVDENIRPISKELGLNVEIGNIDNSNYPDNFFDIITISQVIEHIPDPVSFINKTKKKLKDNGEIILSFPNTNSVFRFIFREKWINWHVPYHQNHFSRENIKILAERTGLRIKRIRTITPTIWTFMQLRSFLSLFKGSCRERPPKDLRESENADSGNQFLRRDRAYLFNLVKLFFFLLISVLNRGIDLLGIGDSFLIILYRQ